MTWAHWRRVRQIVQIFFFALFIYLLFAGVKNNIAPPLADLFFRLNPLTTFTAALASRSWLIKMEWAFLTVGLTLLVGRVWCGWICPLGTLLEWVSFRSARKRATKLAPRLRHIKYFGLVIILVAALVGNTTLLMFDPIAIFTRVLTAVILPGLNSTIIAVEKALYAVAFLQPAVDGLETARLAVLPAKPPIFTSGTLILLLFGVVLALNLLADRFWCRYLCPLGALLGWLSRLALLRPLISSTCNQCTRCALTCRPGAIQVTGADKTARAVAVLPAECTMCLDCLVNCARKDMSLGRARPALAQPYDLSRRQALAALGAGLGGALLLKLGTQLRARHPFLLRPPGAQNEDLFLAKCVRCAQCLKICPTSALQPATAAFTTEGLWTPKLTPRIGYCNYSCNACGQVCPSGAIPNLPLEQKRLAVIGKAEIDHRRCLPWSEDTPCIVCEEMCPLPDKAIQLNTSQQGQGSGEGQGLGDASAAALAEDEVLYPVVIRDLCIGCGICESHCPLAGEAAIRVYTA